MIVVKKVSEFDHRGPGAFRSWLRSILTNRVGDYIRSERGRVSAQGGSDARDQLESLADSGSPLSRLWDREHDAHLVGRAMALVRPDFADTTWEAFTRQSQDGQPAREVAGELRISVNAALVAKSRVLRRLRAELAGMID
jgi:RNA polymerase sigma-70 factor (ECF subfamily)